MDTSVLKNFAQESRRYLMDVVRKKIDYYLTSDNADIRAKKDLIDDLKNEIASTSKGQVVEKIAYTWFNRFCALRYMDVKQYSVVGVLTPASLEHTQPEILMEAKSGHIKDELGRKENRDQVIALLSGKASSFDPQNDAYKLLLLMACNYYHSIMPFLFEKVDDFTELLMPDDLLSEASIISKVREALSSENCENVEVIGWLYQFYISEKKDEVFADLKNNIKITPENIPAATQLFTPNWIVRYLVENSLGRLWMLNRPNSNLISKMVYYIVPESIEPDFLKIKGPEEIKICDPACGSGHMLVYAFELLYMMYEEEGIDPNEIPSQILKNNLFGIEIDERAGELAAFALTMKARERQRRYFRNPVQPNICVLENIHFEENEIIEYMDHIGRDLFTEQFQSTLQQTVEAKNFGSLIKPELTDVDNILSLLDKKNVSGHLLLSHTHSKVLHLLNQVKYLSPQYHVVIANPPYMGGRNMNDRLLKFSKTNYPNSKADAYGMFIERNLKLAVANGYVAMITIPNWMFLGTFEQLREEIAQRSTILNLVHNGRGVWGGDFGSCSFVLLNSPLPTYKGKYKRLFEKQGEIQSNEELIAAYFDQKDSREFSISLSELKKIPSVPIAYWISNQLKKCFIEGRPLGDIADVRQGLATSDNGRFLRYWWEVDFNRIGLGYLTPQLAAASGKKWFPYNKGGEFRKWYGNNEYVINWHNDGEEIKNFENSVVRNPTYYFRESVTWSFVSSSYFGVRYSDPGAIFDVGGSSAFPSKEDVFWVTGLLCSKIASHFMRIMNPTLNFQVGNVANLPVIELQLEKLRGEVSPIAKQLIDTSREDWNSIETSWGYDSNILLKHHVNGKDLEEACNLALNYWQDKIKSTQKIERDLNFKIGEIYKVENEISPDISQEDVTFLNNPVFRYGKEKDIAEARSLLCLDYVKDFISYAVGCIFGRYRLNQLGLNFDYSDLKNSSFSIDQDNVVPILEDEWFSDDLPELFKKFLKVTFGADHFEKNISFIELHLGKDIRKYFFKDFYNDHLKKYKKRPIYWLFSSPSGSFNALIYTQRYLPDTVSVVLNSYLREFRTKLNSKRENLERLSTDASASVKDKTAAIKEIEQLKKMIVELDEYEKDILYPLATQRLVIDLDDGVKANYPKFGKALKPIKGLDKDED